MVADRGRFGTLRTRVVSGFILAAVAVTAILTGGYLLAAVLAAAVAVATWELVQIFAKLGAPVPLTLAAPPAVFFALVWLLPVPDGMLAAILCSLGYLSVTAAIRIRNATIALLASVFYPALLGFYLGVELLPAGRHGWQLVIVAVAGVAACDMAAYFVGSSVGRHKFFPRISPRKSLEGALGGWAGATVVVTLLMRYWLGAPVLSGLGLGASIGVIAQAGDLLESALKRRAGVKDSSRLIPGHGGLLDRLDSLLLVAPVVYCWTRWLI